jgi:hypothetical protein
LSSLWHYGRDAILSSREPKPLASLLTGDPELYDVRSRPRCIIPIRPVPSPSSCSNDTERDLPPTPVCASPCNLSSNIQEATQGHPSPSSPISPSVYAPTRPVSRTSSAVHSPCVSPSVANLGRRSMVKQRLTQFEHNSSQPSTPRLTSPSPTDGNSNSHSLKHRGSIQSNIVDLILDSYSEAKASSNGTDKLPSSVSVAVLEVSDQQSLLPFRSTAKGPGSQLTVNHHHLGLGNTDHSANLDDQSFFLQQNIRSASREMTSAIGCDAGQTTIYNMIYRLDIKTEANGQLLESIAARLTVVEEHWQNTPRQCRVTCLSCRRFSRCISSWPLIFELFCPDLIRLMRLTPLTRLSKMITRLHKPSTRGSCIQNWIISWPV